MTIWKQAKGYEKYYKVSNHCGIKNSKGKKVETTKTDEGDIVFVHTDGTVLSAIKLAKDTFGEHNVIIPD